MLILVLDTSTPAITAAVVEIAPTSVTLLAERVTIDGKAHGEQLAPGIDAALAEAGAKPRDLAAIVAGLGPGPFTGLRVGLVTAVVMADTLGIPTYGVCSLDGLGALAGAVPLLVATDARRKEVYWAVYRDGVRLHGPSVDNPATVGVTVSQFGAASAVGEGAVRYADQLGLPVGAGSAYPSALELARGAAARVRAAAPTETLQPLYLRRPDAVEPSARKTVL
ncbi:tRNA threonylcarbamoyl adenosine modification protein YeaZ [Allocatelliglobosispora scoriae]|uniref:tRNA threonylcarbamoyl adenosine modification protein YeaZ n=1 Tax=Allocatelliglobosispora scoriae TaxID=643052 RepID=A0A841BVP9_9ACTN|nr:tRNA (adenosine(37)-N6)-threonylcarbamoyltransferase complex dimerization subunit type 1 TsaB [Allocatelliglobosispora scoriae]MBB5871538.1 tRNA threonylcarbamoyl adenosine modification protein YeaZ [Allocatelliglobosispora scoriae]